METKNFLGLEGLNHFWEKAKVWVVNEITTKIAEIVLNSVPVGTVLSGLYKTVPNGFLLCNGTAYLRTEYPKLFAEISNIYNLPTDSADIFRVPDLRNRTVMGANPNIAGKANGNTSNVGEVQLAQLPNIFGSSVTQGGCKPFTALYGAFQPSSGPTKTSWYDHSGSGYDIAFNASRAGASTDHVGNNVYVNNGEVRPYNIRMYYIIKY